MVMYDESERLKKRLLGLASALEMGMESADMRNDFMLNTAQQLQVAVKGTHAPLSLEEKVRIVKSLCRAKAKAYASGLSDDYKTFRALSTISTDLVHVL